MVSETMTEPEVPDLRTWPSIMDVVRSERVSQSRVFQLLRSGDLHGVRTRIGWLVDPQSVREWQATRDMRKVRATR